MTERYAIDYAWQHPDPAAIKAAGFELAVRYLSHDATKNLTKAEAKALQDQGIGVLAVWETTASRAGQGHGAGTSDVANAEAQADALGYPKDVPIFYAVDFDAAASAVVPYFNGVTAGASRPVGVYGSIKVIEGLLAYVPGVVYAWQTGAWSGSAVSHNAHLYQRVRKTLTIKGAPSGWDENVILKDIPSWDGSTNPAPSPIPTPPKPKPKPAPAERKLNVKNIDLRDVSPVVRGPGIKPLQRLLNVSDDGLAGPQTQAALRRAQVRIFGKADLIFGPNTAEALLAGK